MPGKKPRIYWGTQRPTSQSQEKVGITPKIYFGQTESAPTPLEDMQEVLPEQDTGTSEPIQTGPDELDAFLRQQDALHAREEQSEAAWQLATQEPIRYQPPAGYSRLGRDIQTGAYVDVTQSARRQGLYTLGLQGYGKSGLFENLSIQDIKQGIGVCVLDPKGELVNNIIARLPDEEKEHKVILLDINEKDLFPGLNLFACADPTSDREIQFTLSQVTHVFEKAFGITRANPRLYDYLYNCAYTLIANPGSTMMDIRLLLTNPTYRSMLLGNVTDAGVLDFWQKYYNPLPERQQREEAREILRRLNDLSHDPLRYIVGQTLSTINLQQIMDEGKILLVKLNSKRFEEATRLIGSIIVALILNASDGRQTKKQFNLYADEFQRFATDDFATLIEEARSAGIGVAMAHQNRGQLELSEKQADANLKQRTLSVGSLVVFRVPTDAESLAGQFAQEPDPAQIETQVPQRHERIEEQIEVEVEEEVKEIPTNPVDFLVSARGTHGSPNVRRATQETLIPLVHAAEGKGDVIKEFHGIKGICSPFVSREVVEKLYSDKNYIINPPFCSPFSLQEGKNLLNTLLVDVMEGRVHLRTRDLAGRIETIAIRLAGFIGWYAFPHFDTQYPYLSSYESQLESREKYESALFSAASSLIRGYVALGYQRHSTAMKAPEQDFHHQLLEMLRKNGYAGRNGEYGSETQTLALRAGNSLETFVENINTLCKEVATEEGKIKVPTGQTRMVKRRQPSIHYLTKESDKITHQQPSEQEMTNRMIRELINLPLYTARVKTTTAAGIEGHAIRTLEPEKGIRGVALQNRIQSIKDRNIQDGYLRTRAEVEEEISKRQEQCNQQPPEPPEEPPIFRKQQN